VFWEFCYSKPEIARLISETAINKSKSANNDYLIMRSLLRNGVYYDIIDKKDSAMMVYDQVIKIAKPVEDKNAIASVYNNKGLIYWNQENYDDAISYYLKSLKIFENLKELHGQANCLNNIGLILGNLERYNESVAYHQRSLQLRKQINDAYGIGASLSNISHGFAKLNTMDSAIFYAHKAIKVKTTNKDLRGLAIAYNNLGLDYEALKKLDSSLYYLQKSESIYKQVNSKKLRAENIQALGWAYYRRGQYDKAIECYNLGLELVQQEDNYTKLKIANRLGDAYHMKRDYENASKYYQRTILLQDTISKENVKVQTQEIFEKYNFAEKEKQILIQRADLAEKNLTIQKQNYQLYGLIGLSLILIIIGYLFYNQQKLKNEQIHKENELKDALIKIETQNKLQEQRLRISRDLHDNIGAQLTFIISSIDNLKYGFDIQDQKLTKKLDGISNFTSSTIYELRDTIWAMNKSEITFEDLQSRISNYINKAHVFDDKINFSFNVSDGVDLNRKFSSVEGMNIHRVIQEAIHNSLKHANPTQISVDVSKNLHNLQFVISDDGKGFDIKTVQKGNGLINMQKRIQEIGGELQINISKNTGTQVVILL
jgi:signal transduction histidine kinase